MNYRRIGKPVSALPVPCARPIAWLFALAALVATGSQSSAQKSSPAIGFITEPVRNYEPFLIFGEGFEKDKLEVLCWEPAAPSDPAKLLGEVVRNGFSSGPDAPPKDGHIHVLGGINPLSPQVLGAVVRGNANVIWVRQNGSLSRPYVVNRPRPFFVEHDLLTPGQESRLFGKYLVAQNDRYQPRLWLVSRDRKDIFELPWGTKYDYQGHLAYQLHYELRFRVPSKVPPGDYDLWLYSGAGGQFGFGDPLSVRVQKAAHVAQPTLNMKAEGAKGDGQTDDVSSIEQAMTALDRKGGGTLYFPEGRYLISRPIRVLPGISLKGAAEELSRILAAPNFKADSSESVPTKDAQWVRHFGNQSMAALIYLAANSKVSHLTL